MFIVFQANMDNKSKIWWQAPLAMFARLSGLVVIPVLIAVLIGNWLDAKLNMAPWLLLICLLVSFIFSMIMLSIEASKEYKKIIKEADSKKTEK